MIHGRPDEKLTFFKNGVKNRIMTYECFRHDISFELKMMREQQTIVVGEGEIMRFCEV